MYGKITAERRQKWSASNEDILLTNGCAAVAAGSEFPPGGRADRPGHEGAAGCDRFAGKLGYQIARCGGLASAVEESLKEQGITDFELKPISCNGLDECKLALVRKSHGRLDVNFIEGMACVGGCIGGAGCLTHGGKNNAEVDKYGREASKKSISEAVSELK